MPWSLHNLLGLLPVHNPIDPQSIFLQYLSLLRLRNNSSCGLLPSFPLMCLHSIFRCPQPLYHPFLRPILSKFPQLIKHYNAPQVQRFLSWKHAELKILLALCRWAWQFHKAMVASVFCLRYELFKLPFQCYSCNIVHDIVSTEVLQYPDITNKARCYNLPSWPDNKLGNL